MSVATVEKQTAPLGSYQGAMIKQIIEMTTSERVAYYQVATLKAKERLFAIGQPWIYEKDGQVIAEHPDGRVEIIH